MSVIFWKDLAPQQRGSETATMCIKLLKDRFSGKISEVDFEKELNYVSVQSDCIKDFRYKNSPPKTLEVQNAEALLEKERVSLRANEVLDMGAFHKAHPCLMDYSEEEQGVVRHNQRNAEELERLHEYFVRLGDQVSAMKVYEAYQSYPPSLWIGNKNIWKRRKL